MLKERVVRDPTVPAALERLGLLLTVVTLESRPEEPWLRRPGEKVKRAEVVCVMEHEDT